MMGDGWGEFPVSPLFLVMQPFPESEQHKINRSIKLIYLNIQETADKKY